MQILQIQIMVCGVSQSDCVNVQACPGHFVAMAERREQKICEHHLEKMCMHNLIKAFTICLNSVEYIGVDRRKDIPCLP